LVGLSKEMHKDEEELIDNFEHILMSFSLLYINILLKGFLLIVVTLDPHIIQLNYFAETFKS
jgi:hypothetical protein